MNVCEIQIKKVHYIRRELVVLCGGRTKMQMSTILLCLNPQQTYLILEDSVSTFITINNAKN